MSLVIRVDDKTIDRILVIFMYLQLVILEFFGYGNILNKIISIAILLRLVTRYGKAAISQKAFYIAMGSIIIYALGGLVSLNISLLYSNLLNMLYPMIYSYYIFILFEYQSDMMDGMIKKGSWVFNLTMIINLFVLYRQIVAPYSIKAVVVGSEISYYEDLISGLFQYASTHVVCLFTSFIVIYNLASGKQHKEGARKIPLYIFIIIVVVASASVALLSDNKAIFLVMPVAIIVYFLLASTGGDLNRTTKFILGICTTLVVVVLLYSSVSAVQDFLDNNVFRMLDMISTSYNMGSSANGSNERVAMIGYALGESSTWLLGKGFGSTNIFSSGYLGFNHFGQADLGMMLILGGIWYTALMIWFYLHMFIRIISKGKRTTVLQNVSIAIMFLCIIAYTQCMTRSSTMVCMMLLMSAYRFGLSETEAFIDIR